MLKAAIQHLPPQESGRTGSGCPGVPWRYPREQLRRAPGRPHRRSRDVPGVGSRWELAPVTTAIDPLRGTSSRQGPGAAGLRLPAGPPRLGFPGKWQHPLAPHALGASSHRGPGGTAGLLSPRRCEPHGCGRLRSCCLGRVTHLPVPGHSYRARRPAAPAEPCGSGGARQLTEPSEHPSRDTSPPRTGGAQRSRREPFLPCALPPAVKTLTRCGGTGAATPAAALPGALGGQPAAGWARRSGGFPAQPLGNVFA